MDVTIFLTFFLAAYILTLGFGIMLKGPQGAAIVTRGWVRSIRWVFGGIFSLIANIFRSLARMVNP